MATILLSIKPEYANRIFDGQKQYEYRKRIPKKDVSKIVVYSSAPEQAVIGEIKVIKTLKMKPTKLWNSTKANAGISRSKYTLVDAQWHTLLSLDHPKNIRLRNR